MTRREEIAKQAEITVFPWDEPQEQNKFQDGFIEGAKWADNCWQEKFNRHDLTSYGRLYSIWINIKSRCNNKNNAGYYRYGKRGISICEEWNKSFINFAIWSIFNGYEDDLSIDRINVDGDYEPSNCRWADSFVQLNNTSRNHKIGDDTIGEIARKNNINYRTLHNRITRGGMTIEEAISCKKAYKYKKIYQYSKEGLLIAEYESALQAAKILNPNGSVNSTRTHIQACCQGKRKTVLGYIFSYNKDFKQAMEE
jgi:hypothetical protein